MAEPLRKRWTVDEVEALPYDEWRRYEIIDGELFVSTAARYEHQMTQKQIIVALDRWNGESRLGQVIPTPGVIFAISDAVIPDVVWVSRERLAALLDDSGHLQGAPELMVEVLSPGPVNERRDREIKLDQYSRYGVQEYWLFDWQARTVDVYRQSPSGMILAATLRGGDTLTSPLLPGFSVAVAGIFSW